MKVSKLFKSKCQSVLDRNGCSCQQPWFNSAVFCFNRFLGDTQSSVFLEASGIGILRTDAEDYLLMKFGPHGGGHGHYDKLSIIFYTHENLLLKDYGIIFCYIFSLCNRNCWI